MARGYPCKMETVVPIADRPCLIVQHLTSDSGNHPISASPNSHFTIFIAEHYHFISKERIIQ